jgi:BirA family biotin operon repressor/biotin-[acetyl-CoA-carboxylase] ligase
LLKTSDHKDEILVMLRRSPGEYLSGRFLAESLGLGREVVYHAVWELRQFGYDIESDRRLGYRYRAAPDLLIASEIREGLKTKLLGKRVICYRALGSTNEVGKQLADSGAPEGTLIVAEEQTRGRGRFGRAWHSPPKCGLYFTLILRPPVPPPRTPALSIIAALSVVEALRGLWEIEPLTKWPNDVLLNRKKVCGILTELLTRGNGVDSVIVGVGINVNHKEEDFPKNLRNQATSIRIEVGREVSRLSTLRRFLLEFEGGYLRFLESGLGSFREHYRRCSAVLGRSVKIRYGNKMLSGTAEDIGEEGSLVLRKGGRRVILPAGEITRLGGSSDRYALSPRRERMV